MKVTQTVIRYISMQGHHVIEVDGVVLPEGTFSVLPQGWEVTPKLIEVRQGGGSIFFKLQFDAAPPKEPVHVPVPIAELTTELQRRAWLVQQLDDPHIDEVIKDAIRQSLSIPREYQDVLDRKKWKK